ncbi:MAG: hypothetical protein RL149_69 [Actinomycetota bacterium]
MRTSTKNAVGVITLGVLGISYQLGQSAEIATAGFATPAATSSASPSASSEPLPSESASVATQSSGSETTATGNTGGTAPQPSASASASTSAAPAPQPSASATKSTTTSGASVTKSGSVEDSTFGMVQVQVTKSNGKITDITMLRAEATHGRAAAFPYLIQYAINANGTNFGNLSGATYTTNAFKRSLEAALAKF